MKDLLPAKLNKLGEMCPFPLYLVGGSVRDYIAGLKSESRDYDICAPAGAEEFGKIAESAGFHIDAVYKNTGTVKLSADGLDYEFTSFRSDEYVRGEHVPANIYFTKDITLDARRRDFKCNAVYYDISAGQLRDPLGGIQDIGDKILSTVAPAKKVFGEDGLRLMRLARFAGQTGFKPSKECMEGARANASLISDISAERIWTELKYILSADKKYGVKDGQYVGLKVLYETGVMGYILPELAGCAGVEQRADFHRYDVLEHSLRAVMYAEESVRLAALLHDIGKPVCIKENGRAAGHERVGAEIAKGVCARLKVPKNLAERTVKLIELHMYDLSGEARESKSRKFVVENYSLFDELMLLKQADFSACMDDLSVAPFVKKYERVIADMRKKGIPLCLKELDLRGDALIKAGAKPKEVGGILEKLLSDCITEAVQNSGERLLERAEKLYFGKY